MDSIFNIVFGLVLSRPNLKKVTKNSDGYILYIYNMYPSLFFL
ncbi:hypothetical protein [Tepidibacter mesophilus]|nr:hypothetical protein [Tepidibacter mesophilus]